MRRPWVVLVLVAVLAAAAPADAADPTVAAVEAVGLTVSDMERSLAFYTGVLGFVPVSDVEVAGAPYEALQGLFGLRMRVVRLSLGAEAIELTEYLAPRGRPAPVDSRSHDRWFQHVAIVVSDMDRAYAHLRRHRVRHASPGPQRLPDWNPNAGGIRGFYFRDPDDHPLELIQFPPGKGDPRWQQPTARLFLGIDHTAIVVGDTETALGFYRDRLGLRVVGESENHGEEQERLNNVFGARLRITTLRAAAGPGIELLEYLAPRDGRPIPSDQRPNDLAHWQTRLRARPGRLPARGAVTLPDGALGFGAGALVRDPDGHGVLLVDGEPPR
jgi:catechol 2,3-dioxygenase-like lactoylglutathione lyase family enzyme